jgi:hypothetical protein
MKIDLLNAEVLSFRWLFIDPVSSLRISKMGALIIDEY